MEYDARITRETKEKNDMHAKIEENRKLMVSSTDSSSKSSSSDKKKDDIKESSTKKEVVNDKRSRPSGGTKRSSEGGERSSKEGDRKHIKSLQEVRYDMRKHREVDHRSHVDDEDRKKRERDRRHRDGRSRDDGKHLGMYGCLDDWSDG